MGSSFFVEWEKRLDAETMKREGEH
jgi:hypothetical protein